MKMIITKTARAAVLALGLLGSAHAEELWNNPGVAPYAPSIEDGCRKADEAIDGLDILPEAVQTALKLAVAASRCNADAEAVWLTPGQQLTQMWAGGANPHVVAGITVAEIPVAKAPDGRTYRNGAVAEAIKAWQWTFVYKGVKYVLLLPAVCSNWSWYSVELPTPPSAAAAASARALPVAPPLSSYALQINCMSDRPDGYWRYRYEEAKTRRAEGLARNDAGKIGMMAYYNVFTKGTPFGGLLAERKSRPLDCKFLVRFLKREPVLNLVAGDSPEVRAQKYDIYLREFQSPQADNVLTGKWVSTGARGWVIVPITVSLDQFEAVLIQPENVGDVLEPVIAVHRPEFAGQSNPVHVWEVWQGK